MMMCKTLFLCVYISENDCMCFYVNVWGVCMCINMLCQMCLFVKKEDDHFYVILFDTCHAL
jgi:hypothetical protein